MSEVPLYPLLSELEHIVIGSCVSPPLSLYPSLSPCLSLGEVWRQTSADDRLAWKVQQMLNR